MDPLSSVKIKCLLNSALSKDLYKYFLECEQAFTNIKLLSLVGLKRNTAVALN